MKGQLAIGDIPFAVQAGLRQRADGLLELPFCPQVHNHLQTVHASAQFTLAETASGMFLHQQFPALAPHVLPVLRSSETTFRKPATSGLTAYPSIREADISTFETTLHRKGFALIKVSVTVKNEEGAATLTGRFIWFVQTRAEQLRTNNISTNHLTQNVLNNSHGASS
ncbi:MAG: hypothetical protein AUJ56_05185 [Zetaproteobacteria bacterium CG1_02_49_23]|nr:MAG: hypothetical protein AUJ56_05185 [Zetaproteobacteria bacterium CG1_02_49_23]